MKAGDLKPGDLFTVGFKHVYLTLSYCDYVNRLDEDYAYEEPRVYAVVLESKPELYAFDKDDEVEIYEP